LEKLTKNSYNYKMKIYCPDCGTAINYAAKKPNFCQSCGNPLSSSVAKQLPAAVAPPEEVDTESDFEMPDIDKLDVEIDVFKNKVTFGELANAPQMGFTREKGKTKQSRKKFLEQWKQEAGGNPHKDLGE
jgi:hypothetical protein